MVIRELRKIEEILGWHNEFDIGKLIKKIKMRSRITAFLFSLLLIMSVSFVFIMREKKQTIANLKLNVEILQNTIWVSNDMKDSLMNALESSGYLKYLIETESGIKIPKDFNKDHVKYMFERSIDNKIPLSIMFRLVFKESTFDSTAVSSQGAYGYMQIMPKTYELYCEKFGIESKPHTAEKNIYIGSAILRDNYDYWKERKPAASPQTLWRYTLATYNVGNANDSIFQRDDVKKYIDFIMKKF